MRWFRFAALILLVTVLQASALANLNVGPDLLLILVAFFCFYCNTTEAITTSFVIGFAADLISSPIPMGVHTISFGVFGTLLAYVHRVINIRNMPFQAVAIFTTALLVGALSQLLAIFKGQVVAANIWTVLLGLSIYSGIVGPFLFLPSAWWMRIKANRFARQ